MCKKYRIGITFNLETDKADIWANGANQNVIFLYQLFRQAEIVESVVLVSWGPEKRKEPPEGFMLDDLALNFAYVDEVLDELDVLIEGTLVIDHQYATRMHEHGGKIVAYKMGNDYIMDMEYFLFDRPAGRLPNGVKFDAVWVTPQHQNTGMAYYSTIYHAPAYVVPFIWGTIFCDKVIARIKKEHNLDFGYQPTNDGAAKRVASFEPNINVLKTCFTPILICEHAYRTDPNKIKHYYVCNTYEKRNNPTLPVSYTHLTLPTTPYV